MRNNPEDRRVKYPALVHLARLGYTYLPTHRLRAKEMQLDEKLNIILNVFRGSLERINSRVLDDAEFAEILRALRSKLDSDDLGEKFTDALHKGINGLKLIDFTDVKLNVLHVTTELPVHSNDDDLLSDESFRPDITVFVNGLPLSFIEVKRENNLSGVQAERNRMNERSMHPGYRSFLNMMQFVAFSNNMEYNDAETVAKSGGFYTAINPGKQHLNRMRDEEDRDVAANLLGEIPLGVIGMILEDNNVVELISDKDFNNRLSPTSPTNSFITSLYRPDRLFFLLRYGIAYRKVSGQGGLERREKHVMRYPQIFATKAIASYVDRGNRKGVIWHTQGSGKTALAYFNVHHLSDYYQMKNTVAQFFFIVDRIDLALQAKSEFEARGLEVTLAKSREDFAAITSSIAPPNLTGKKQITVVNIHKFSENCTLADSDYSANVQRVYFIDEAHRSYDPKGSFLANLINSDHNAVVIALTGTPLLTTDKATKDVFGRYIHTYYYNQSISDGYTLRLMREHIATEYQEKLSQALKEIQVQVGAATLNQVKEHPNYIEPLAQYLATDLVQSRQRLADETIGGMVVCCSTEQARALHAELEEAYPKLTFGLVLHDEGDKATREKTVTDFKVGRIDMLIVYNMLLTGFDAPRLKRLYLERLVAKHNLLQTLTRVNRPYGKHQFGSVVDFADISEEFDKTNKAYLEELKSQLGDEWETYTKVLITEEEVVKLIQEIKEVLWEYNLVDLTDFIDQINALEDRSKVNALRKALTNYLALYNLARLQTNEKLFTYFDIFNARKALNEVTLRASTLAAIYAAEEGNFTSIIEAALDATHFRFTKLTEIELEVADAYLKSVKGLHRERERNLDPKDPQYSQLSEEIDRLFKAKNFLDFTSAELSDVIIQLEQYRKRLKELNDRNARLAAKYHGDEKFMRIHKRIEELPEPVATGAALAKLLDYVKCEIDGIITTNEHQLDNLAFFNKRVMQIVLQATQLEPKLICKAECIKQLASFIAAEYTMDIRRTA